MFEEVNCCRNALCMRSEVPYSNLCRITGYLEATAKGSDRLFHLLTLPHSPHHCAHYLPYAIVCHSAVHHSDRKVLLKHLTSYALNTNVVKPCVTSSVRREVHENSAFLGYYSASSGDSSPTFRCNRIHPQKDSWPSKMRSIDCPETSVRNYHYSLRNNPEERSSHL